MSLYIEIEKEIFNDAFYPLMFDDSRILALKGSAAAGKSYFIAQKWILRHLNEQNHRTVLLRKVGKTIRNSQYKLIGDIVTHFKMNYLFDFRESDMVIRTRDTNSEFISIGVDDKEKIKSLAGLTGMWMEEVTELSPSEFHQSSMRLRGNKPEGVLYKQLTVTFNPIEAEHWIKKEMFPDEIDDMLYAKEEARRARRRRNTKWIDFKFKDVACKMQKKVSLPDGSVGSRTYTLHHSIYEDNRFLDIEDKMELLDLKSKDIKYYNVYALGRWGSLNNLVFDPQWRILKRFPTEFDDHYYGLDFGYHHPSALVSVGVLNNQYYVRELLWAKGLTNPQLIEYIKENKLITTNDEIYADDNPAYIAEFEEAGFNIQKADKGNDSVMAGIDLLKSLTIFSHKDNININRELKLYKWAVDDNDKPIEGKVIKLNDDGISATRYAIFTRSFRSEVKIGFVTRKSA